MGAAELQDWCHPSAAGRLSIRSLVVNLVFRQMRAVGIIDMLPATAQASGDEGGRGRRRSPWSLTALVTRDWCGRSRRGGSGPPYGSRACGPSGDAEDDESAVGRAPPASEVRAPRGTRGARLAAGGEHRGDSLVEPGSTRRVADSEGGEGIAFVNRSSSGASSRRARAAGARRRSRLRLARDQARVGRGICIGGPPGCPHGLRPS